MGRGGLLREFFFFEFLSVWFSGFVFFWVWFGVWNWNSGRRLVVVLSCVFLFNVMFFFPRMKRKKIGVCALQILLTGGRSLVGGT